MIIILVFVQLFMFTDEDKETFTEGTKFISWREQKFDIMLIPFSRKSIFFPH